MASLRNYNNKSKTLGEYICLWCGNKAIRPLADAMRQKYCSNTCAKRARGGQLMHVPQEFDKTFGNWLAGFTDGEGTFILQVQHEKYVTPRFVIRLRADDKQILEEIRTRLGFGDVESVKQNYSKDRPGTNPAVVYECRSFCECNGIMELFEKFPLRAKKARDFEIWKEGIKLGLTDCENREAFLMLASELATTKQYSD